MAKVNRHVHAGVILAVDRAWKRSAPLSKRPADGTRFVGNVLGGGNAYQVAMVAREVRAAIAVGEIREQVIGRNPLTYGLRLAETSAETSDMSPHPEPKHKESLAKSVCGDRCGDAAETRRRSRKSLKTLRRRSVRRHGDTPSLPGIYDSRGREKKEKDGLGVLGAPAHLLLLRSGHALRAGTPFAAGDVVVDHGQRFVCLEVAPWVRKDGVPSAYSVWQSECAYCGARFTTTAFAARWLLRRRRCTDHTAPRHRTRFAAARAKQPTKLLSKQ